MRRDQLARRVLPEPTTSAFARQVLRGLEAPRKWLPCSLFYDARGSELFEEITRRPEYYPTRTETTILRAHASEMVEGIHADGVLVEFGSGSSTKTEILLRHLSADIDYVAIDVSEAALTEADARLARAFPLVEVHPIIADFSKPVSLPKTLRDRPKVGFFPGSTIGNLTPPEAATLLANFRSLLGASSRLIVGVDLKKDTTQLLSAYNDSQGVTAAFNLNILARINRELGSSIDIQNFAHEAIYNAAHGRIEMHLVSLCDQDATICGQLIHFSRGETIHTENSYKYTIEEFQAVARAASWTPTSVWTDADNLFSIHELR